MILLEVAVAGAAGALARYGLSGMTYRWLGSAFPWGTLVVNLLGCLLIGLLVELSRLAGWISPEARTTVGIGFLGAFTTFSTFEIETYRALESGDWRGGGLNLVLSVLGGLALVVAGTSLARLLVKMRGGL